MKPRIIFTVTNLASWVIVATFAFSLPSQALGQGQPPPGSGPPPSINPKAADRARQMNEERMRSAELVATGEAENQKHVQEAIVNMKADFARIQVVRNDIARNLVARKPLDYNLIAAQTGEINQRANRLNVYMLAHTSENKEQNDPTDPQGDDMVHALVKLCKLIDSFTDNPALKDAATTDVKEMMKAKEEKASADKDLLAIIKLSESIHKRSDSLKVPQ
jgi:hypothetical protein